MKKLLTLFAMLTLFVSMMAQTTPLNYQAVLRDPANNELVRNQAGTYQIIVVQNADPMEVPGGEFQTNADGMVNLPLQLSNEHGIEWMYVDTIKVIFTYGNKEIEIVTPVTPVPYAFHTDGSYLTTDHIVDYITRENIDGSQINGDDIDTIYRALKRNAQLHDGMRDSIVNYIMKNYEKAKEIGYHYLFLITATDLNQFYQEGRTIDQEVKDSIYSMAKQFLKENRDMLVELAKYYAETATAAEVNQLYNELLSNSTANAKIRELLYGYFDAYLVRKGLDGCNLCDIYRTIINNGAPTVVCPAWTSSSFTPELIDGNYKATLTFAGNATSTTVSGTYIATVSGVPGVETAIPGNGISVNGYSVILNVPASSLTTMEGTGDKIEFKIKLANSNDQCTTQPVSTGTYEQGQFGCVTLGAVTVESSDNYLIVDMPFQFYNPGISRQSNSGCKIYVNNQNDPIYTVMGTSDVSIIDGDVAGAKLLQCLIPIAELNGATSIVVKPFVNVKCQTDADYYNLTGEKAYELTTTIEPCASATIFTATAVLTNNGLNATLTSNGDFNWTNRGYLAKAYDANNTSKTFTSYGSGSGYKSASISSADLGNFIPKTVVFEVYGDGENCETTNFSANVEGCPSFGESHVRYHENQIIYVIPFDAGLYSDVFSANSFTITIHQSGQSDITATIIGNPVSYSPTATDHYVELTTDVLGTIEYSSATYTIDINVPNCSVQSVSGNYSEWCPSFGTTTLCKNMNDGATVETGHSVTIRTPIENYDPSIGTVRYDISFYVSEGTSTPGVRHKSFNVTEIADGYCTLTVTESDWLGGTQSVPMNPTTTWNVTPVLNYTNTSLCGASQVSGTASGAVQYNNIPACNN